MSTSLFPGTFIADAVHKMAFLPSSVPTASHSPGTGSSTMLLHEVIEISSDDEGNQKYEPLDDEVLYLGQRPHRFSEVEVNHGPRDLAESSEPTFTLAGIADHPQPDQALKRQKLTHQSAQDEGDLAIDETAIDTDGAIALPPGAGVGEPFMADNNTSFSVWNSRDPMSEHLFSNTYVLDKPGWLEARCEVPDAPARGSKTGDIDGKRSRLAPYYDDTKLGVRMYRGPGYEKFPVVLGSNPEHKMICDRWNRKEARRVQRRQTREFLEAEFGAYMEEKFLVSDDDEVSDDSDDEPDSQTQQCLRQILDVVPDVSHRYTQELIKSMIKSETCKPQYPCANDVVDRILSSGQYPKEKATDLENDGTGETIARVKGTQRDKSSYLADVIFLLAEQFPYVPTHYIFKLAHQKQSLYETFMEIERNEENYEHFPKGAKPYKRIRQARGHIEKKYTAKHHILRDPGLWGDVINELQATKQSVLREQIRSRQEAEKAALEAENTRKHIEEGNTIECQCCFDDEIPANRAVSCEGEERHQYCFDCVTRLAGDRLGSMKYEMQCMSSSGCKATLCADGIRQAVTAKVYEQLAYYQQQAEIEAAGIEGLEQCAFCDFKGICEPVEVDPVFSCQNPECRRMTCRLCQEQAHSPKTCEQVKRERNMSRARQQVEEARSEAMMRTCPRCKKRLIKESGCNKMRCRCGNAMCYVCQKDISKEGYAHFMKPPSMCPQSDESTFDRHGREAYEAERKAIKRIRDVNTDFEEKDLQIETKGYRYQDDHQARQTQRAAGPLPLPTEAMIDARRFHNFPERMPYLLHDVEGRPGQFNGPFQPEAINLQRTLHPLAPPPLPIQPMHGPNLTPYPEPTYEFRDAAPTAPPVLQTPGFGMPVGFTQWTGHNNPAASAHTPYGERAWVNHQFDRQVAIPRHHHAHQTADAPLVTQDAWHASNLPEWNLLP